MVIDAHQHFLFPSRIRYPWLDDPSLAPIRRDFTPADLRPLLKEAGVDKTILVQTRSSLEETYEFLTIALQTDFVAGVVGWVDLADPEVGATLDALLDSPGGRYLVGIRHQVHDEPDPDWLLQDSVQRGIAELGKRGLAYDFLTRARELPACLETARNHPEARFVVDHIAKPNIAEGQWEAWEERLAPLGELPNVWCKLSGIVTEARWDGWTVEQIAPYVAKAVEIFGPDRCLFGSDWPVCNLAASYGRVKEALESVLLGMDPDLFAPGGEKWGGIFGRNAEAVYRLGVT